MKTYTLAVTDLVQNKAKYFRTYSETRAVRYAQKKRRLGFQVVIL